MLFLRPTKTFEKIWTKASRVPGYLSKWEGFMLYETVRNIKVRGNVLEIGTFCGRSTVIFASSIKKHNLNKKVYTIDDFSKQKSNLFPELKNPKTKFIKQIHRKGLEDYIYLIEKDSIEALKSLSNNYCIVFFDGDHTKKRIKKEIKYALPKIENYGKMIFHDVGNKSVDPNYSIYLKNRFFESNKCVHFMDSTKNRRGNGMLIVEVNY